MHTSKGGYHEIRLYYTEHNNPRIHASVLFAGGPAYVQLTRKQVKTELAEDICTSDDIDDPVFWRAKGPLRQAA